jgi:CRP/FNR family cyclic AMP-dependent transcriptional regulator
MSTRAAVPATRGRQTMTETIWFLKHCELFERVTPEQAKRLEQSARMRRFKRREVIYFPTEPGESVLLLASGRVKIKNLTPEGKELILAFVEAGELFGELALFDEQPRSEFAEAVTDAQVLVIPRDEMLWLMQEQPAVSLQVTKLIGLRRRRIENRLRNVMFRSNRDRVLSLLLELVEAYGRQQGRHWEISLNLSHQEMAGLVGATRETVTVALGQLQLEGLIRVQRRRITVLDRGRLAAAVAGNASP